ncbi:glycosyltransferase family protein [Salibacter halophilus]|uniref:Glycosyltransferase family 4 protein n=1 Tax=Salibacter halophilus TaxID=1803916 RepID=A0A6N6M1S4_9FLAO|nr:glycosyltransferase family 4 protein [Salibacter halophilus]KAB1062663.1 glycosyltransferase family 4 protein [Salibacter halophilus]
MNKRVLILTYYWPPGSGPGVQRWLKFSKYLIDFGWKPEIVTVRDGSYPSYDESLIDEIPSEVKVHKTKTIEPFKVFNALTGNRGKKSSVGMSGIKDSGSPVKKLGLYVRANFFIPDARMGWNKFAQKKCEQLLSDKDYGAVITTGPPHSTHLIGLKLKEKFGVNWIADFRDPWTGIYYNEFLPRTQTAKKKDAELEKSVLKSADSVITVSEGLSQELADISNRESGIEVLFNGFDTDDLPTQFQKRKDFFVISYIGNYKDNQVVPELESALEELLNDDENFKNDFRLIITGNISPQTSNRFQKSLGDAFIREDFVQHKVAVEKMVSSGMLLFVIPQTKGNHLILTGKLFEYLASGSDLLSIGPVDGNASKIIESAERGDMIDYSDKASIKDAIMNSYENWKQSKKETEKFSLSKKVLEYSRKGQAKELIKIIENCRNED